MAGQILALESQLAAPFEFVEEAEAAIEEEKVVEEPVSPPEEVAEAPLVVPEEQSAPAVAYSKADFAPADDHGEFLDLLGALSTMHVLVLPQYRTKASDTCFACHHSTTNS